MQRRQVGEILSSVGLDCVRIVAPQIPVKDVQALRRWQEAGYSGEMAYMNRAPEQFACLSSVLPGVISVIMVGLPYDRRPAPPARRGQGRIARYAWGRDYHKVFTKRLRLAAERLKQASGCSHDFRAGADSLPVLERALARSAGVGFIGKNTMLIRPGEGSYLFLGAIYAPIEIEPENTTPLKGGCGSCFRCSPACPTGAIPQAYTVDGSRCISYLTIEKRGVLAHWEQEAIGDWLFGCDICQEVCPFNHAPVSKKKSSFLPELDQEHGVGPNLSLDQALGVADHAEMIQRFAGTPLMRAKRAGLVRNALCVTANTGYGEGVAHMRVLLENDPEPSVRATALWSLYRMVQSGAAPRSALRKAVRVAERDQAGEVQAEYHAVIDRIS